MIESQLREMRTEHIAVNAQMEAVKSEMKHLISAHEGKVKEYELKLENLRVEFQSQKNVSLKDFEKLQVCFLTLEKTRNKLILILYLGGQSQSRK